MDKALESVVEAAKQASPALWAAAQAKVAADIQLLYVGIWLALAFAAVLFVSAVLCSRRYMALKRQHTYNSWDGGAIVCTLFGAISLIASVTSAFNWYSMSHAPAYYAIQALRQLV